jgi:hypothetical protein
MDTWQALVGEGNEFSHGIKDGELFLIVFL